MRFAILLLAALPLAACTADSLNRNLVNWCEGEDHCYVTDGRDYMGPPHQDAMREPR
ncbi:hypothetical protein [uncultured Parasphingopyxis sp.]|uniref:hypothetical protein n=1 Tax=uncultured Parasphingopyxis sp. TaxID=1547918 RepID=UPI00260C058D|nr:hypothetical protein [uncultured Parasphingopyxis sp.]